MSDVRQSDLPEPFDPISAINALDDIDVKAAPEIAWRPMVEITLLRKCGEEKRTCRLILAQVHEGG